MVAGQPRLISLDSACSSTCVLLSSLFFETGGVYKLYIQYGVFATFALAVRHRPGFL